MITIKTEEELFDWLFEEMLLAEPMIIATPGLPRLAEVIHREVQDVRYLARYDEWCWEATFSDILTSVSKPGKVQCSAKVIDWLTAVYAAVAGGEPDEPLLRGRINRMMIDILNFEGDYLRIGTKASRELVLSTARCQRKFGVAVAVNSPL